MAAKRWSYAEITEATESLIRVQMERASATDDRQLAAINRHFADGAYLLWHRLTVGVQKNGDDERLNKLIERPKGETNG